MFEFKLSKYIILLRYFYISIYIIIIFTLYTYSIIANMLIALHFFLFIYFVTHIIHLRKMII